METQTEVLSTPKIRVVFMGTPDFASSLLQSVLKEKYNVVAVYTRPDGRVGRKQEITQSPVKLQAEEHRIPCEQPIIFDAETLQKLQSYEPDLIIVVAYGKILPKEVLAMPGFGCVNVHPSLLPKYRGPSPIQNALLQGETETGTTIMLMNEGMDTGPIMAQKPCLIESTDTLLTLSEKLATLSSELLLQTLPGWIFRTLDTRKQDDTHATLCQLIERTDGQVIWLQDAETIYNRYRALTPWPGLYCFWKRDSLLRLKLHVIGFQKNSSQMHHPVGHVFEIGEKIGVQTSLGVIFLEEVQLEGKTRVLIRDFILGYPDFVGSTVQ